MNSRFILVTLCSATSFARQLPPSCFFPSLLEPAWLSEEQRIDFFLPLKWENSSDQEVLTIQVERFQLILKPPSYSYSKSDKFYTIRYLSTDYLKFGWNKLILKFNAAENRLTVEDSEKNVWVKEIVRDRNTQYVVEGLFSVVGCKEDSSKYYHINKGNASYTIPLPKLHDDQYTPELFSVGVINSLESIIITINNKRMRICQNSACVYQVRSNACTRYSPEKFYYCKLTIKYDEVFGDEDPTPDIDTFEICSKDSSFYVIAQPFPGTKRVMFNNLVINDTLGPGPERETKTPGFESPYFVGPFAAFMVSLIGLMFISLAYLREKRLTYIFKKSILKDQRKGNEGR